MFVPFNIAEGYNHLVTYPLKFKRHIMLSISSNDESKLWLRYSKEFGYLSKELYEECYNECEKIGHMLFGLYERVKFEIEKWYE